MIHALADLNEIDTTVKHDNMMRSGCWKSLPLTITQVEEYRWSSLRHKNITSHWVATSEGPRATSACPHVLHRMISHEMRFELARRTQASSPVVSQSMIKPRVVQLRRPPL